MFTVWSLISLALNCYSTLPQIMPEFKPHAYNPKTGQYEFVPAPPIFSPKYEQWRQDRLHRMPIDKHWVAPKKETPKTPVPKRVDPAPLEGVKVQNDTPYGLLGLGLAALVSTAALVILRRKSEDKV